MHRTKVDFVLGKILKSYEMATAILNTLRYWTEMNVKFSIQASNYYEYTILLQYNIEIS